MPTRCSPCAAPQTMAPLPGFLNATGDASKSGQVQKHSKKQGMLPFEGLTRNWHALWLISRVHARAGAPEMLPYQGQTIREGWFTLTRPGGHWHRDRPTVTPLQGQDGDEREPGPQDGSGACDGLVRPLAWGLESQLGPGVCTRHLDRPAPADPGQDLHGCGRRVGTEERFHAPFARGVAHQDKAEVGGREARRMPQGRAREPPPLLALAAVPVHRDVLPGGIRTRRPGLGVHPSPNPSLPG
jgi:hypothetical protein